MLNELGAAFTDRKAERATLLSGLLIFKNWKIDILQSYPYGNTQYKPLNINLASQLWIKQECELRRSSIGNMNNTKSWVFYEWLLGIL